MLSALEVSAKINKVHKCGEILRCTKVGGSSYTLNCFYCPFNTYALDLFALHIDKQHKELKGWPGTDDDAEETLCDEEEGGSNTYKKCFIAFNEGDGKENQSSQLVNKIKEEKGDALVFKDPLEDAPLPTIPNDDVVLKKEADEEVLEKNVALVFNSDNEECNDDGDYDEEMEEGEEEDEEVNDNFGNIEDSKTNSSDSENCSDSEDDVDNRITNINDTDAIANRNITLAIILGYERHRILWDVNNKLVKSRKKREEAFRNIAASTNDELGVHLKWKNVGEIIKKIRYKFRTALQNQKLAEVKGEAYVPPWFFNKLSFLKSSIKYKQRNKRGTKALANEKSSLPMPNLTDAQNEELIEIYKGFPCLWDVHHIAFRFKKQRQEGLKDMLQTIRERMNLILTQEDLQKKLYRIRYAFTQEKHRKLQCESLEEEFIPACKYYEQILFLEDHVGPFKCSFCEEIINGADQYRIHKSKHDGSMPFTCPVCKRGFMKAGNCTVHLRRHTRDYPFECQVCGKRYATTTDVNVHMRQHTGEKPYFCEICGQNFRTWSFFASHMRRHEKRPTHKCSICDKAFYENNKLKEHMKAHLNVRDKVCNICEKAFTSAKYLRQHKQIHAEKKKYVCKICSKHFAQYAGLSGHMKSHGTTVNGIINEENHC